MKRKTSEEGRREGGKVVPRAAAACPCRMAQCRGVYRSESSPSTGHSLPYLQERREGGREGGRKGRTWREDEVGREKEREGGREGGRGADRRTPSREPYSAAAWREGKREGGVLTVGRPRGSHTRRRRAGASWAGASPPRSCPFLK